jgi:capsular polysaccharide biosynthesis protein
VRPWLAVVAGVLAGLVAGAIWTWAQPNRYRADARVLVRPPSSRIVPAVQALAESSLVATNVQQTLRLASPPHVSAKIGKGGVLTVSVEAGSRERARQIDAEAVAVLTQKVAQRFATTVNVTATVLDPAHAAKQTSPTPGRNLLISGLAGLVAGLAVAGGFVSRRPRRAEGVVDPAAVRRLQARIDEVAIRERALARRAGELAAREQDLGRREQDLAAAASRPSPPDPAIARRAQDLERQERKLAAREAELAAAPAVPEPPPVEDVTEGGWNLRTLERLVGEHRAANPAVADEWSTYLFLLRQHADAEGALPRSFDDLVADVFGNVPGLYSGRVDE